MGIWVFRTFVIPAISRTREICSLVHPFIGAGGAIVAKWRKRRWEIRIDPQIPTCLGVARSAKTAAPLSIHVIEEDDGDIGGDRLDV